MLESMAGKNFLKTSPGIDCCPCVWPGHHEDLAHRQERKEWYPEMINAIQETLRILKI